MVYDIGGKPAPVIVRNVSQTGVQFGLSREIDLQTVFNLSLTRGGDVRRSCKIEWQFATVVGVSFRDRP
jgi:hypothetical protein